MISLLAFATPSRRLKCPLFPNSCVLAASPPVLNQAREVIREGSLPFEAFTPASEPEISHNSDALQTNLMVETHTAGPFHEGNETVDDASPSEVQDSNDRHSQTFDSNEDRSSINETKGGVEAYRDFKTKGISEVAAVPSGHAEGENAPHLHSKVEAPGPSNSQFVGCTASTYSPGQPALAHVSEQQMNDQGIPHAQKPAADYGHHQNEDVNVQQYGYWNSHGILHPSQAAFNSYSNPAAVYHPPTLPSNHQQYSLVQPVGSPFQAQAYPVQIPSNWGWNWQRVDILTPKVIWGKVSGLAYLPWPRSPNRGYPSIFIPPSHLEPSRQRQQTHFENIPVRPSPFGSSGQVPPQVPIGHRLPRVDIPRGWRAQDETANGHSRERWHSKSQKFRPVRSQGNRSWRHAAAGYAREQSDSSSSAGTHAKGQNIHVPKQIDSSSSSDAHAKGGKTLSEADSPDERSRGPALRKASVENISSQSSEKTGENRVTDEISSEIHQQLHGVHGHIGTSLVENPINLASGAIQNQKVSMGDSKSNVNINVPPSTHKNENTVISERSRSPALTKASFEKISSQSSEKTGENHLTDEISSGIPIQNQKVATGDFNNKANIDLPPSIHNKENTVISEVESPEPDEGVSPLKTSNTWEQTFTNAKRFKRKKIKSDSSTSQGSSLEQLGEVYVESSDSMVASQITRQKPDDSVRPTPGKTPTALTAFIPQDENKYAILNQAIPKQKKRKAGLQAKKTTRLRKLSENRRDRGEDVKEDIAPELEREKTAALPVTLYFRQFVREKIATVMAKTSVFRSPTASFRSQALSVLNSLGPLRQFMPLDALGNAVVNPKGELSKFFGKEAVGRVIAKFYPKDPAESAQGVLEKGLLAKIFDLPRGLSSLVWTFSTQKTTRTEVNSIIPVKKNVAGHSSTSGKKISATIEVIPPDTNLPRKPSKSSNRKNMMKKPADYRTAAPYVEEYIRSYPGASEAELEALNVLGKFMNAGSSEGLSPIQVDQDDPDLEFLSSFLAKQTRHGKPAGKELKWLIKKIGQVEGRRRFNALLRQVIQPTILLGWEKAEKQFSLPPFSISRRTLNDVKKVLEINKSWPTFFHSRPSGFRFLKKMLASHEIQSLLLSVLGEQELVYRISALEIMCQRVYPHNWFNEEELQDAYKQGLEVGLMVMMGDTLQFGRGKMSFAYLPGLGSLERTYVQLGTLFRAFLECSWESSAEKQWLMSKPLTSKLYVDRIAYVKKCLREVKMEPKQLLRITCGDYKQGINPWWNLADTLEWVAEGFEPSVLQKIGASLNLSPSRNEALAESQLEYLRKNINRITNKLISTNMAQKISTWFELNAKVPDTQPTNKNEPQKYFSELCSELQDLYTGLLPYWKQRSLSPSWEHPIFPV